VSTRPHCRGSEVSRGTAQEHPGRLRNRSAPGQPHSNPSARYTKVRSGQSSRSQRSSWTQAIPGQSTAALRSTVDSQAQSASSILVTRSSGKPQANGPGLLCCPDRTKRLVPDPCQMSRPCQVASPRPGRHVPERRCCRRSHVDAPARSADRSAPPEPRTGPYRTIRSFSLAPVSAARVFPVWHRS
jgi:hypothetical protein